MMLLGTRESFALGLAAIGFRMFYLIYVDNPQTLNSNWILAIAATIVVLPIAVVLLWIGSSYDTSPASYLKGVPRRIIFLIVLFFGIFDAAASINLFSQSASYMALESIPTQWIRLTCVIAAAFGCIGGLDCVGSTARVWLRILFWLLLVVVVSILGILNVNYFYPILGPGIKQLAKPVLPVAGTVASIFPIWLLREKPRQNIKRLNILSLTVTIGIVVAALLMLSSMILPPMINAPSDRMFQLDKLLTNGRVGVLLQFTLLFIWFGCYIASLSYSLVFSVHSLTSAFQKMPRWVSILICSSVALALSFFEVTKNRVFTIIPIVKLVSYTAITASLAVERAISLKRGVNKQ